VLTNVRRDSISDEATTDALRCISYDFSPRIYCTVPKPGFRDVESTEQIHERVNMSRGMSGRSSEVRVKHALAGTEGHSHLVIWVNYKCSRTRGGKMSWTAVSPDTHTHTHSGSQPVCTVRSAEHRIPGALQVELGKSSLSQPPNSFLTPSLSLRLSFSFFEPPTEIQECMFLGPDSLVTS